MLKKWVHNVIGCFFACHIMSLTCFDVAALEWIVKQALLLFISFLLCLFIFVSSPSGAAVEAEWNKRFEAYKQAYPELAKQFQDTVLDNKLPEGWEKALPTYKAEDKAFATRINSQKCINALAPVLPGFMGGSADLAPSNMSRPLP